MPIAFYLTAIWFFATLFGVGVKKYHKASFPKLNNRRNILLLALEVLALLSAIYWNVKTSFSPYILIVAVFLLFTGYIKSHQGLLLALLKGVKKRPWVWRINFVFEGTEHSQNIYFLGDWLQIIAIAFIWNSLFSLALSCFVYPVVVYILSSINTREFNKKVTGKSELIRNETWANFKQAAFRSFTIALIPLLPFAIAKRDVVLFFGTFQNAYDLISTLAQVEATVLALVITFLFVLVEFTNAAYSPRLVKSFVRHWSFTLMLTLASVSIFIKFTLMANVTRFLVLSDTPKESLMLDLILILTIVSVLGYFVFIRNVVQLMQPEAVAKQILSGLDNSWIENIRKNWHKRNKPEQLSLLYEDPMVLFERYLATTIERGDVHSTKLALVLMRDKISRIEDKDDGAVIDSYLHNRIGNIVDILVNKQADLSLQIFCEVIGEITTPSVIVIKNSPSGMFDSPPGAKMLQLIAEKAVDAQLLNSARRALFHIENRCEAAIKVLPPHSELWLLNSDKLINSKEDQETRWNNDRQLETVIDGYFSCFANIGQKAAENSQRDLVWAASSSLSNQIGTIIKTVEGEAYQKYLLSACLRKIRTVIIKAGENKIIGGIYFGHVSLSVESVDSEQVGILISNYFSEFLILMANAGILDVMNVIDVAVMSVYLARKHPITVIPILNGLGHAGNILRECLKSHNFANLRTIKRIIAA
jgi:hypothetical protein